MNPTVTDRSLDELASQLSGAVIRPDDPGYAEARGVWNGMIDRRPAAVVQCSGTADVVEAVRLARSTGATVSVRGGGHNVAGLATNDGGIVIDLSCMRAVEVDAGRRLARAQGGATIADLDAATQQHGLATPMGVVSETGIAGLTLSGGYGWLRRKYGLSCDNLIGAEIVTADGEVHEVSEDREPDLLWALRGGGGNFGAVTRLDFRLHLVGPEVAVAAVMYPLAQAPRILRAWRDYLEDAPDEVSAEAVAWTIPAVEAFPPEVQGEPVIAVVAVHCGSPEDGEQFMWPLRKLSRPLVDLSGPQRYTDAQQLFDPFFPRGQYYYWKALEFDELTDEFISAYCEHAAQRPSPNTVMPIWQFGGAMARVPGEATAFGDRKAAYLLSIDASWLDPADTEENVHWARRVYADMGRFSGGGVYLNFPGLAENPADLVRAAYGANHRRLAQLKARYDPTNFFRMNLNIAPDVAGGKEQ